MRAFDYQRPYHTYGAEDLLDFATATTLARYPQEVHGHPNWGLPNNEDGLLLTMVGGQPNSGMVAFDAKTGKPLDQHRKQTWMAQPKSVGPANLG